MADTPPSTATAFARGAQMKLSPGEQRNFIARICTNVAANPTGVFRTYDLSGNHRTQTYADTWHRSAEIAAALCKAGATPSQFVVLLLDDIADFVAGFWACLRARLVAVPLMGSATDAARYSSTAFVDALALLGQPYVLADAAFSATAKELVGARVRACVSLDSIATSDQWRDDFDQISDPIGLIATSGSTGRIKLAALTHSAQLHRNYAAANDGFRPHLLGIFPLDGVTGLQALCPLSESRTQIPSSVLMHKPAAILDAVEEFRITSFGLTNSIASKILAHETERPRIRDLSSLRSVGIGAEPVTREVLRVFAELLERSGAAPDVLRTAYGTTETGFLVTGSSDCLKNERGKVLLGEPWMGVNIRIVDTEGKIVQEAEIGEVEVHCPEKMFAGYWKDPVLTRAGFTDDGWWRTGDLGEIWEGQLALHGRAKDVLIIHGRKFSLVDIDAALLAVIGVGNSAHACAVHFPGKPSEQLAIVYSAQQGIPLGQRDLGKKLRSIVAQRFGLHADPIIATEADRIPRTGSGKLRRAELSRLVASGELTDQHDDRHIAPHEATSALGQLAAIWCDIFGLAMPPDRQANFFDLGGDSLRALTLYLRIKETFGVDIESDVFFSNPTLEHLGRVLCDRLAHPNSSSHSDMAWPLTQDIRHRMLAFLETWPGTRPTADRLAIGINTQGRKPPLFWICNEQPECTVLAEALGVDQPLYVFHSGIRIAPQDEEGLQMLALRYVSDIAQICPEGPLFIGGNCQGAIVALAVAQHALRRKRHVPLLILVEWTFELQRYAGRVLLVPGRTKEAAQFFARPERAWGRAFDQFSIAQSTLGYALQESAIGDLGEILTTAMAASLTRPLLLLTAQAHRSAITAGDIPRQLSPGERIELAVTVNNDSSIDWDGTAVSGLALGCRWTDPDGDVVNAMEPTADLPPIGAGTSARVPLTISAPREAAEYRLHLDVVADDHRWFHTDPAGAFTAPITIVAPQTVEQSNSLARKTPRSRGKIRYTFDAAARPDAVLLEGWSRSEPWGVWSNRTTAKLRLPLAGAPGRWRAIITCRVFGKRGKWVPVRLRAGFAGEETEWRLPARWTVRRKLDFVSSESCVTLRFTVPDVVSPRQLGIAGDPRQLGIGLIAITLQAL